MDCEGFEIALSWVWISTSGSQSAPGSGFYILWLFSSQSLSQFRLFGLEKGTRPETMRGLVHYGGIGFW